jgi:hypothetical protein
MPLDPGHPPFAIGVPRFACLPSVVRKKAASPLSGDSVPVTGFPACRLLNPCRLGSCLAHSTSPMLPVPSKMQGLSSFTGPHLSRKRRARLLSAHDRLRFASALTPCVSRPPFPARGCPHSSRQGLLTTSYFSPRHFLVGLSNGADAFNFGANHAF